MKDYAKIYGVYKYLKDNDTFNQLAYNYTINKYQHESNYNVKKQQTINDYILFEARTITGEKLIKRHLCQKILRHEDCAVCKKNTKRSRKDFIG